MIEKNITWETKPCLTRALCETDFLGFILGDSDLFTVMWDRMRGEAVDAGTSSLWLMNQPLPIPRTHRPVVKRSSTPLGGDQV